MIFSSVEQSLNQQVKEEIGDEENVSFLRKNQLLQKYGVKPAIVTKDEQVYWGMCAQGCNHYVE